MDLIGPLVRAVGRDEHEEKIEHTISSLEKIVGIIWSTQLLLNTTVVDQCLNLN